MLQAAATSRSCCCPAIACAAIQPNAIAGPIAAAGPRIKVAHDRGSAIARSKQAGDRSSVPVANLGILAGQQPTLGAELAEPRRCFHS